MRIPIKTLLFAAVLRVSIAQTDWPIYGHDPGGLQYSPLNQINSKNVKKPRVAGTPHARPPVPASAPAAPVAPAAEGARPARPRTSEASPLVVGGVLYL